MNYERNKGCSVARIAVFVLTVCAATPVAAQHCVVDPTGSFPGGGTVVPTIADALAGPCSGSGVQIDVYCPPGGGACVHDGAYVENRQGVLIRSLELDRKGDPVILAGNGRRSAHVVASNEIRFEGISEYDAPGSPAALEVEDSRDVSFIGPVDIDAPRFGLARSGEFAFVALGDSSVNLHGISLEKSWAGLWLESRGGRHPAVDATALAIYENKIAGFLTGGGPACPRGAGPRLEMRGDFGHSWVNYLMGNGDGFYLDGSANLSVDHAVVAGNLRPLVGTRYLLTLEDASRFEGRNLLMYDNDARRNPGVDIDPHGQPNTNGMFVLHETCDEVVLTASSLVHDEGDHLFQILPTGSGQITLDHVLIGFTQGKVLSASSFWVTNGTCPPLSAKGTIFWQNRVDMDPPGCLPGSVLFVDPGLKPTPHATDRIPGYPAIPKPPSDLYLLDSLEPVQPYPLPPNLYDIGFWSVDGFTPEAGTDLDVGYHNPRP